MHATFYKDGQMSTVFKAKPVAAATKSSSASEVVALKVTSPSSMVAPHKSEKEARVLEQARHECVVPLLDTFWQAGGRFVLVFPFLTYDLETLLRHDALSTSQSLKVIQSLFKALAYLHGLDIIHRDVKPSNILLRTQDGPAYLADFGIAWSPTDRDSEPSECKITDVGTTAYRPPELLFGYRAYDTSLDIWAAGCVVAEIMRPDHASLFDAGELGTELALIKSIFSTLGTPNETVWPVSRASGGVYPHGVCRALIMASQLETTQIGGKCSFMNTLPKIGTKASLALPWT